MMAVEAQVRRFVLENYLFGQVEQMPADGESLVESGVIDSTGVLELIDFLESEFEIVVADNEAVPENLDSIECISRFIVSKQTAH